VRLGLTHRMLDLAVAHLAGRLSDGAPLTARQLVQAAIADVATALETCWHGLAVATDTPGAAWLHARLDRADLTVAGLFGAAGYLLDHPVRCLHVAALVREAWAPGVPGDTGWDT
jgi:alkylation response protein AidB-like acyl-CoA dehydrogenase